MSEEVEMRDVVGEEKKIIVVGIVKKNGELKSNEIILDENIDRILKKRIIDMVDIFEELEKEEVIMKLMLIKIRMEEVGEIDEKERIEEGKLEKEELKSLIVELENDEGVRRGKEDKLSEGLNEWIEG